MSTADLASDEALKVAPVIYQRHLEKRWDIRVTIVDNSIYAAAIHSQEADSAKVDWRRADEELEHKVHALPEEIDTACQRLMKALNLRFGAVDLVLAPTRSRTISWRSTRMGNGCGLRTNSDSRLRTRSWNGSATSSRST